MILNSQNRAGGSCLVPVSLRTEYLPAPLGLDTPVPRLGWVPQARPEADRGARQTAYHIRVASSNRLLTDGKGDLWDTGEIESDETAHIEYQGVPLRSGQHCYWSVALRDAQHQWSPWSDAARFSMGPASPDDWSASWIGTGESVAPVAGLSECDSVPPPDNVMPNPWFRKSFTLAAAPSRATANVASVGYHELFVNGRKVGDAVLTPSVTDYSKRARFTTYEIADYLRAGENVIGLWLGTGWSTFPVFSTPDKPRAPIVFGQFDLQWANGQTQRIATDASWKTHPSPSTTLGIWYFMNFGGEQYDANKEIDGWAKPGLDEKHWRPAVVFRPRLELSGDKIEPNRLGTKIRPRTIIEIEAGAYRVDMGKNFAGWTEITVNGKPGDRVEFLFSERSDQTMTHRLHNLYVVGPDGRGVFRNRFNYSTGRWITIRGLRQKPQARDIRGWLVRNDYAPAANFECSHELFNEIYRATTWTLESLMLGGYIVDCPHRERMGYGGDGHATITTALSVFGMGAACTKWSEDWRDMEGRGPMWGHDRSSGDFGGGTLGSGHLPYTAPTYWGGGGPAWSGFAIHLAWEAYQRYGDERILRANFPLLQRWLGFLETMAKNDLLRRWGGNWDFLGDWLWPGSKEVNGDTPETLFFNNCYWIYTLQIGIAIAELLDRSEVAANWRRRTGAVRRALHEKFYNSDDSSYVNGSQAYLASALLADVPPPSLRASVWRRLEHEILVVRSGHIHAGITGGAMLFKLLMGAGRDDLIHAMVDKEDYPSWGHMLREGATTIWEAWSDPDSRLHSSFLFVGAWFIHGVLGIQPDREHPGFRKFIIRPGIIEPPKLTSARGHYDSIRGRISVAWKWSDDRIELHVGVPANTTAVIHVPTDDPGSVNEASLPVSRVREIKIVRAENRRLVIEVGSGQYDFTAKLEDPCLLAAALPV